jgi:hypothetical protein
MDSFLHFTRRAHGNRAMNNGQPGLVLVDVFDSGSHIVLDPKGIADVQD